MSTTSLDDAIGDVLDHIDDDVPEPPTKPPPYVTVIPVDSVFADPAYQRPLDDLRVQRMAAAFDPTLLGVLEVSDRGDGTYAVIDGQHRWALVRELNGGRAPLVCNVHRGLAVAEEARLFYEIDSGRRTLTGWDRWWARRGAGEQIVLDIERVIAGHDLRVIPNTVDGSVRATRACEYVVELGGLDLLDRALGTILAAFGPAADALDGDIIHGTAQVLAHYGTDELQLERLVAQMQTMPPRQIKARAGLLREAHRGTLPRLTAAVIIERYNAGPGRKVEDFLVRVPASTKSGTHGASGRRNAAIRAWAQRSGHALGASDYITKAVRAAYDAAHPAAPAAAG